MTDTPQLPFTFTPEDFGGDAAKAERYNAGLKALTLGTWVTVTVVSGAYYSQGARAQREYIVGQLITAIDALPGWNE